MKDKSRFKDFAVYFVSSVSVLVTILFLIFLIRGSFTRENILETSYNISSEAENGDNTKFQVFGGEYVLEHYTESLWNTSDFWFYFWNSCMYSVPILLFTIVLSVLAGYGFAKFRFPLRRLCLSVFIILMMVPYQVMVAPTYMVLNNMHLVNTRSALILPNIFTAFGTFLIYQFIRAVPDETLEAARLDGAGNFRTLISVILPQIKSGIVSLAVLNFIDSWNMVEQPVMFLKNEFMYPLSTGLSYFQEVSFGTVFVCGCVFTLPVVLIFLIGKEHLREGITNSVFGK